MEPIKKVVTVTDATYVKDAEAILLVGECENGKFRQQIDKSCFSFGDRSQEQIDLEMEKTAKMFIGKRVYMVFDPELDKKIEDHASLKY